MTENPPDDMIWVYVEFNFDTRVAHFYGRIKAELFDPLTRKDVRDMVPLHTPFWYSEAEELMSCRRYQGGDVLYFDPARLSFLMKVDEGSDVMKDIRIAQEMGRRLLPRPGNN